MGKMSEIFMQTHYPVQDYEREYLTDRLIIDAEQEEDYLQLLKELNTPTKIEVANGERQRETRIETGTEKFSNNQHIEV